MKINLGVRWKNKTWIVGVVVFILDFVYGLLERFEVVPVIDKTIIATIVDMVAAILVGMGILIDPTTKGISDSDRAMEYTEPN